MVDADVSIYARTTLGPLTHEIRVSGAAADAVVLSMGVRAISVIEHDERIEREFLDAGRVGGYGLSSGLVFGASKAVA